MPWQNGGHLKMKIFFLEWRALFFKLSHGMVFFCKPLVSRPLGRFDVDFKMDATPEGKPPRVCIKLSHVFICLFKMRHRFVLLILDVSDYLFAEHDQRIVCVRGDLFWLCFLID